METPKIYPRCPPRHIGRGNERPITQGDISVAGLSDLMAHCAAWRAALVLAKERAPHPTEDTNDAAYWQHEINAFDAIFERIGASPTHR